MASIDKRKNGTYRARWREYPGGPQRAKQFTRKIDAEQHLVKVQHDLQVGAYITPEAGRTTLWAFTDLHLSRALWRPSTMSTARASLGHALSVLGDRPLVSIRRGDVQAMLSGLDLAPGTVRIVRQHLGSVFAAAVEDGLVARNPMTGLKVPQANTGDVVPPTVEQVASLMASAPAWFRPAIVLGAGLGLRQAEASGLTVDRVDWMRQTVRVDRQWRTKGTRDTWGFAPTKTAASTRTIPAASAVLAELGEHVGRRHDGFVVHREGGGAVDHNRFNNGWRATCKAAGIEGMRYHSLRHHFASALISAGCSVKAVQHALGHTSATTTLTTYSHLWPGDEDRIRAAIEVAFSPAEDSLRTEAGSKVT